MSKEWLNGISGFTESIPQPSDEEMNKFFESDSNGKEHKPIIIKCPHCGKSFEK
jgi:hypothetical protein